MEEDPGTPPLTPDKEEASDSHLLTPETEDGSAALTPDKGEVPDSPPLTPEEEQVPDSHPPIPENSTLKPPIWSVFRGGIYETLPYYRAYKGGLYTKDLLAKGFLIDRQKEVRDFMGAQVVITSL